MTTPQHAYTQRARMSLTTTRCARALADHEAQPRLHEGWLRIASVLQPLRWWAHRESGCGRGIAATPSTGRGVRH